MLRAGPEVKASDSACRGLMWECLCFQLGRICVSVPLCAHKCGPRVGECGYGLRSANRSGWVVGP